MITENITTFTLEEIDRSVYNIIRKAVVAATLLPDIADYTALPEVEGKAAYLAAKNAIDQKRLTEVFGVGTGESRGKKDVNKIIINRKKSSSGSLGGGPSTYMKNIGTPQAPIYQKRTLPDTSRHLMYDIRILTNTTLMERVLEEIVYQCFGTRRYTKSWEDYNTQSEKYFMLMYGDSTLILEGKTGTQDIAWNERMLIYSVRDIWLESEVTTLLTNIVPLSSVDFRISLSEPPNFVTPDMHIKAEG